MPLFMDFHKFDNISIEAVKTAHIADIGVQDQYGVKYHQFWVNEAEGIVFYLMEGPDAASCEKVHQLAHGNVACALSEVAAGMYEKMIGLDVKVDHGHVLNTDGSADNGFRNILVASVYGVTAAKNSEDLSLLLTPHWAREIIAEKIKSFGGRIMKWEADDSLIGILDESTLAVQCALQIQEALTKNIEHHSPAIVFKIGVSVSQPVTKDGDFFNEAIKLAHRLSTTVQDNQVLTSTMVKRLCRDEKLFNPENHIRSLSISQEEFITKLLGITEANLSEQDFHLDSLSSGICVSRPQLYRKVKALTGRSPNDFVNDLRMSKALALLKQKKANITEIAFQTGFNSPSYFTKCFVEKYGCKPSLLTKLA